MQPRNASQPAQSRLHRQHVIHATADADDGASTTAAPQASQENFIDYRTTLREVSRGAEFCSPNTLNHCSDCGTVHHVS